jgi:hypothetical protein
MDLHEFYKNHYFFELSRKDQLSSAVTIPAGLITLVGGGIIGIFSTIDKPFNSLEKAELLFLILATITIFISIFFLIKSYFNYGYGFIATSLEIMTYKDKLEEFHKNDKDSINIVQGKIEDFVNREYVKHTDLNTRNNDRKSSFIHKANWALILSIVLIVIAGIPHVIKSAIDGDQVYKIQIVKKQKGDNVMPENENDSNDQSQKETENSRGPEPTPPEGRVILEDTTPPIKDPIVNRREG